MNATAESNPASEKKYASLEKIVTAQKTSDGAGVNLHRSLGSYQLPTFDPFLLLDEFKSKNPDDYLAGFPSHPHRGFETVTYMLEGQMKHEDSNGNQGIIRSGGVQWMTAGRGIIHSEMPLQENGLMWGFQIWVNLPAREKMKSPHYQNIDPEAIPEIPLDNGGLIRVIAGESRGIKGIVDGVEVDPLLLDIHLKQSSQFTQVISAGYNSLIYVYKGSGGIEGGGSHIQKIREGQLGVLSKGTAIKIATDSDSIRLLILSGKPINEPIARHGPFVMTNQDEIKQAIEDYRSGRF